MHVGVVWLAVFALLFPALSQCEPLFVLTAPSLLRVGCKASVFLEAQEYAGESFEVSVHVKTFPTATKLLFTKAVILSTANNFQALQEILISDDSLSEETHQKQYVYLEAMFPQQKLEQVILLSFQPGYIFVQTDKPIYTPQDSVLYRGFVLNASLKPKASLITVDIMGPDGKTKHREDVYPDKGTVSGLFRITEFTSVGTWKIIARFTNSQQKFTYDFQVKEYVQPNFEVRLTPLKKFFNINDTELSVEVAARYLHGKDVSGKALVVFGVLTEDGEKKSLPASQQHVTINSGKGKATLKREQILKTFPDVSQLIKLSLYMSVSVLADSGSEKVEAERRGIPIVTSPYTIQFKKTPFYFKPGLPFQLTVHVTLADDTPAKNIDLELTPGLVFGRTQEDGEAEFLINTESEASSLLITVRTKASDLTDESQAVATMTALAYKTQGGSKNYLHISIKDKGEFHVGSIMHISLLLVNNPSVRDQIQHITYLLTSKGQIIGAGRYKITKGQFLVALNERVTEDMVPSFRIVAYYHVGTELVSDSLWVDVKDACLGKLEVTPTKPNNDNERQKYFSWTITGDPGAKVGLVAVDKGVYFQSSKERLTQTKIWDIVEKHDIGCTPGGGADSMGVFSDAGLAFVSGTGGKISRSGSSCPVHPMSRRRRSPDEEYYISDADIVSRTQFPESWFWVETGLPECPPENRKCQSTSTIQRGFLKDTVTTWEITAVSMSETHGICVADPIEIKVMKKFFIDLKLPYSAVRNEQLEIKAVVYNYLEEQIRVRVELMETPQVCSAASKQRKFRMPDIYVDAMSSYAVPFVIIPMALGLHSIEVKAAVYDSIFTYGVRKDLLVVAEGVLIQREVLGVKLTPSDSGGVQIVSFSAARPVSQVPDSAGYTYISVTDDRMSQIIQQAMSGSAMGRLIVQPSGNAENTILSLTGLVIATHYLDSTHQWEKVGAHRRAEAIKFIRAGYNHQMTYRDNEGAYSIWRMSGRSSWLTAYVAKVLNMASSLLYIQEDVLCSALRWLVQKTDQKNGNFAAVGEVYHKAMMGGVQWKDPYSTMTAYVLIALQEARPVCGGKINDLENIIKKSVDTLSATIKTRTNPYTVAILAYALGNEGKHQVDILNGFSSGKTHWLDRSSHLITLEATGYALMALVRAKEFDQAGDVVKWLREQTFPDLSYDSLQANIIVFQAVTMYMTEISKMKDKIKDTELDVHLSIAGRRPIIWRFLGNRAPFTRSEKVQLDANVTVTAKGTGRGTLSMVMFYNAFPDEKKEGCKNFELKVTLQKVPKVTVEDALETYKLTIDMRYLSNRDATMSILDITMLTGFIADKQDLERLTSGMDSYISKIETDILSEKGSLIFYLNKVSHELPDRVVFKIHKMSRVGLLQPAAITLYEYYSMENRCMKFYHPEKKDGALNRICHQDVCRCAEEKCSYQRKQDIKELDRMDTACSAGMDYVYKARMVKHNLLHTVDRFTFLVEDVIREGIDTEVKGKQRTFMAHAFCREAIDLKEGKSYLVMGKSDGLVKDEEGMIYMLGGGTWIEYWPTEQECQKPEFRETCVGIKEATADLVTFGCPN